MEISSKLTVKHTHTHTHTRTHMCVSLCVCVSTHTHRHTHTHDDGIRRNAMRCISPKNPRNYVSLNNSLPASVAKCSKVQQSAVKCSKVQQSAAKSSKVQQSAAKCGYFALRKNCLNTLFGLSSNYFELLNGDHSFFV